MYTRVLYNSVCLLYHSYYLLLIYEKAYRSQYLTTYIIDIPLIFLHIVLMEIFVWDLGSLISTSACVIQHNTIDMAVKYVLPHLTGWDIDSALYVWPWHQGLTHSIISTMIF